ncbi:MAG: hypothetical protein JST12_20340 [Armatimonadetes bacterium]|nr:hypothetical protein [Armatimonadota bacterium]MBS1704024.1 hypothetical protein [Armatimonadota bacterium]MBS1725633.1 hypothetical protein [Armatimonadota bacterium]
MKKQLAVSTIVMLGAMAVAQDNPTPITFRIGFDYPVIGSTRNNEKEFYGIGFQRKISDVRSSEMYDSSLELSLDYYGRGNYRHIPILLNYVGQSKNGNTFWSVGGGLGFIKQPTATGTESIARAAYQASVGLNLTSGQTASFVEVKFFGSESSAVNAYGIYYGVKF